MKWLSWSQGIFEWVQSIKILSKRFKLINSGSKWTELKVNLSKNAAITERCISIYLSMYLSVCLGIKCVWWEERIWNFTANEITGMNHLLPIQHLPPYPPLLPSFNIPPLLSFFPLFLTKLLWYLPFTCSPCHAVALSIGRYSLFVVCLLIRWKSIS